MANWIKITPWRFALLGLGDFHAGPPQTVSALSHSHPAPVSSVGSILPPLTFLPVLSQLPSIPSMPSAPQPALFFHLEPVTPTTKA